jgi:cell division protein ZapA
MSAARGVEISILGREFTVSCTDETHDDLMAAVRYCDTKMQEIQASGKVIGVERIAMMSALNLAYELLHARSGEFDVGDYTRRINVMQQQIDDAIAEQNKLF